MLLNNIFPYFSIYFFLVLVKMYLYVFYFVLLNFPCWIVVKLCVYINTRHIFGNINARSKFVICFKNICLVSSSYLMMENIYCLLRASNFSQFMSYFCWYYDPYILNTYYIHITYIQWNFFPNVSPLKMCKNM